MEQPQDVSIELDATSTAPVIARRFVDEHADDLPAEVVADAELLVSELVTNAVRHGLPAITVRLRLDPPRLGVQVSDRGPSLPPTRPLDPGENAPGGRGLLIVDRVSSQWGVLPHESEPGKTVWFELET
ncbi:ATP-binding protein [Jatrophihabitans fulvus]